MSWFLHCGGALFRRRFLAWRKIFHAGDCTAGDRPEIQACGAAVRAQPPAIALKYPRPERLLRLRRNLLAEDVVDDGRKEVGIDGAVDVADGVDDGAERFVFAFEIRCFHVAIREIHGASHLSKPVFLIISRG